MHGGLKKLIPTNSIFCGATTWATKKGHIEIVWYFHDVIGSMTAKAVAMGPACSGTEDNSCSLCQAQSSFRDAPYSNMILYSFIFPLIFHAYLINKLCGLYLRRISFPPPPPYLPWITAVTSSQKVVFLLVLIWRKEQESSLGFLL